MKDRVVCFKANWPLNFKNELVPTVGEIYTIRDIVYPKGLMIACYHFVEIVNPIFEYREGMRECCFDARCFRPVDLSFGEVVCETLEKQKELEPFLI